MPNVENINKLIDVLKANPGKFKMARWVQGEGLSPVTRDISLNDILHRCGTAACLGGWAQILNKGGDAAEFLGIDSRIHEPIDFRASEYRQLFYMAGSYFGLEHMDKLDEEIRVKAGIRVLEILRDEGVIQWDRALSEVGLIV